MINDDAIAANRPHGVGQLTEETEIRHAGTHIVRYVISTTGNLTNGRRQDWPPPAVEILRGLA